MARLVLSRYVAFLPLGNARFLCGHAFRGPRNVVDAEQRAMLEAFQAPRDADAYVAASPQRDLVAARIEVMRRHGILVDAELDEDAQLATAFGPHLDTARDGIRRFQMRDAVDPRLRPRLGPATVVPAPRDAWSVVFLGRCLVLPGMDALVELAAAAGISVAATGSFPSDLRLVAEARPDFVVVGDLHRVGLAYGDTRPVQYAQELRGLIAELRRLTAAPILVHNLPVPTCAPDGLAAGTGGLVHRVREIDLDIARLASELDEVYVVDVDQALSLAGKRGLVDDMIVSSHHLGSLTWLVERATREPAPTSHPVAERLAAVGGSRGPLEAEHVIADETLRVMRALRGIDRRKCVVVDLDDTLWPGVLAETGAPFPPDLPVDVYPHHLYLGLHEALLALRARGILLACVSKNDEAVVKELWRYPPALAGAPALQLSDFVTYRINWRDKVDNLLDIAAELDLDVASFAFIDDSPHERAQVQARLPEVRVLGDNPFATRWQLLTDPAFQVPRVTAEARRRSEMVRGQLARERGREGAADPAAFLASLDMACVVRRETDAAALRRIEELVARTTQLNTTGERRTRDELARLEVFALAARDRFADYGVVGACLVDDHAIVQLVLSCRVIGLRLEQVLLRAVVSELCRRAPERAVCGVLVPTSRNAPARHVFADAGFASADGARWTIDRAALAAAAPLPPYAITYDGLTPGA